MIQIVEVPLANPAAAHELDVQPEISYPGDPDGRMEWGRWSPLAPIRARRRGVPRHQ